MYNAIQVSYDVDVAKVKRCYTRGIISYEDMVDTLKEIAEYYEHPESALQEA